MHEIGRTELKNGPPISWIVLVCYSIIRLQCAACDHHRTVDELDMSSSAQNPPAEVAPIERLAEANELRPENVTLGNMSNWRPTFRPEEAQVELSESTGPAPREPSAGFGGVAATRKREKRGLRSRPKISRKILKKITPTKVLVGGHIASYAYKQYQNWTGQANATRVSSVHLPTASSATRPLAGSRTNQTLGVAPPQPAEAASAIQPAPAQANATRRTTVEMTTAANASSSTTPRTKRLVFGELNLHIAPAIG